MTKGMFELKPEELRAVIGGATYHSAVNKLPTMPAMPAIGGSSTLPPRSGRSASR
jgi:hypothetical protein